MALVLADRVQETTTTTGTGTLTLAGAVSGFQSFSVVGNGNTTYYTIVDSSTGSWEVGLGTYTSSGTTLSRTTVLASSNSGSLVNFGAGTKQVFVTYPSAMASSSVAGPGSVVDNAIAVFDGTTGKLVEDGSAVAAFFANPGVAQGYTTPIGQIYGSYLFEIALAGGASDRGLRLKYNASNSVLLQAPASGGNNTYVWPAGAGAAGYALTTNGSGTLSWTAVGGAGAATILESKQTITSNYSITAGYNGISVGPVTVSSGVAVTIPSGSKWLVVNTSPGALPVSSGGGIMPAMIWG